MKPVTIIGAGTMGSGIAHVCALAGFDVRLADVAEDVTLRSLASIEANLNWQLAKGRIAEAERDGALSRISAGTDLVGLLSGSAVVIEAAPERRALKADVWQTVSAAAEDGALLASNTSSISITWLASLSGRPDRVVGIHFFNPVPVMALVEIVRGLETSEETVREASAFASRLGKTPVEVRDSPGFVSNRILMPMINEAVYCVLEGVGDAEAVDAVMRLGMAHPMGPLALADLIGLDVCLDILEVLHAELGEDKYRPCPLLRQMVAAGRVGRKAGKGFFTYDDGS